MPLGKKEMAERRRHLEIIDFLVRWFLSLLFNRNVIPVEIKHMSYHTGLFERRSTFKDNFIPKIMYFFFTVLLISLYRVSKNTNIYSFKEKILFLFLITFLFLGIRFLYSIILNKINQNVRDRFAQNLLDASKKSDNLENYSFYLSYFFKKEPFQIELKVVQHKIEIEEQYNNVECMIAETLEFITPLVSAGHRGNYSGAGKMQISESEWDKDLYLLAKNALFLIVIPFGSLGTKKELEWILENKLLTKTIFIMPPISLHQGEAINLWENVVISYADFGFAIPEYDSDGLLFAYNSNKEIMVAEKIKDILDPEIFAMHIKILLDFSRKEIDLDKSDLVINKNEITRKTDSLIHSIGEAKMLKPHWFIPSMPTSLYAAMLPFFSLLLFLFGVFNLIINTNVPTFVSWTSIVISALILFPILSSMNIKYYEINDTEIIVEYKFLFSDIHIKWENVKEIELVCINTQYLKGNPFLNIIAQTTKKRIFIDSQYVKSFEELVILVSMLYEKKTGKLIIDRTDNTFQ